MALAVCAAVPACAASPRVSTPLPVYPASPDVYGQHGNSLTPVKQPRLEFATLSLSARPTFKPTNETEAACELSEMMPDTFEARLLKVREEYAQQFTTPSDSAIAERLFDLAIHLDEIWGRGWSTDPDPVRRLSGLLAILGEGVCK